MRGVPVWPTAQPRPPTWCVVGIGAVPNVEWLRDGPAELANGVRLRRGRRHRRSPNVVAVGDCAAWHEACRGRPHRVEHWTGALERPAVAVATLLAGGRHHGARPEPPYFWSDQYGCRIQFAGSPGPTTSSPSRTASCTRRSFLAVYRRDDQPVAVLGSTRPAVHSLAPPTGLRPGGVLTQTNHDHPIFREPQR